MRMEVHQESDQAGGQRIIYDRKSKTMYILNDQEKTYKKLNRETLKAVMPDMGQYQEQMNKAMQEMKNQMANLPPEQRAMAEQMMAQQMKMMNPEAMKAPQAANPTTKRSQDHRVIRRGVRISDRWPNTTEVHLFDQGRIISKVWTVPSTQLGVEIKDLNIGEELNEFILSLDLPFPMEGFGTALNFPNFSELGVPVRVQNIGPSGEVAETVELIESHSRPIPAEKVQIPSGYRQVGL